jgi:hypothetical protein
MIHAGTYTPRLKSKTLGGCLGKPSFPHHAQCPSATAGSKPADRLGMYIFTTNEPEARMSNHPTSTSTALSSISHIHNNSVNNPNHPTDRSPHHVPQEHPPLPRRRRQRRSGIRRALQEQRLPSRIRSPHDPGRGSRALRPRLDRRF